MVRVQPFAAVRPLPNIAARVASVPYDVVNTAEARRLVADNPYSFLHVVRSEIDLPPATDPSDPSVYAKAADRFEQMLTEGILIREKVPCLYLYRLAVEGRAQLGLVGCCHVDDYTGNVIKKHENTRPEKEDDRTRHILALEAHTGTVLLTYRDQPGYDDLARRDINARPLYHFEPALRGRRASVPAKAPRPSGPRGARTPGGRPIPAATPRATGSWRRCSRRAP
jgi:uncharacterized protein (DUF1015 family)